MDKLTCVIIGVVILALAASCIAGCVLVGLVVYGAQGVGEFAQTQEMIVSEVSVEAPASLRVRNPVGDVTVQTGPEADRVMVEATKQARSFRRRGADRLIEQIDVAVVPEGSQVRVEVNLPDATGTRFGRVDLTITVPEETDLDVMNETGHLRIIGTEGTIRVRSQTGAVRMEGVTLSGDCDVMDTTGDIHFQGRLPEPGSGEGWEVVLRTETGDVEFLVPPESRFTLDAESETGSVASTFELQDAQSGESQGEVGRWLRGGVNMEPDSRNVVLRTETGNIVVGPME